MILVIVLGIVALILSILYLVQNRNNGYWKKRGIVEVPKPGSFFKPSQLSLHEQDTVVYNEIKSRGKPYGGSFEFGTPVLVAVSLEFIRDVCIKSFDNFTDMFHLEVKETDPHLNYMLLNVRGQEWKQLRSTVTPSFTTGRIRRMMHIFDSSSQKLVAAIRKEIKISNNIIDVRDLNVRLALDVIASAAFGVETDLFADKNSLFMKMGLKWQTTFSEGNQVKFFFLNFMPQLNRFLRLRLTDAEADKFFTRLVTDCIAYRQKTGKTRDDVLQLMLEANKKNAEEGGFLLTEDMQVGISLAFILGGLDTVESLLAFTLFELAVNPDVQERLHAEVKEASEGADGLSYDTVSALEYLNMVISETLRKYPPGLQLNRICTTPYKIPNSDTVLPTGTHVLISPYAIHHDPEYWPEPEKFDPLRFTKEKVAERHPMAYLPFGQGPRHCIGSRFALAEAKTTVAKLILNFKFEPCEKTDIPVKLVKRSFILKPEGSLCLKVTERQ